MESVAGVEFAGVGILLELAFGILFIGTMGLTDTLHWHETDSALEPTQLFPEHSRSRNLMQFEPQIDQEFHSDHIPSTLTNVI